MKNRNIKLVTLENIILFYVVLCPILDITSFLFRKNFNTNFSPSTIIRPIIPILSFIIIFIKDKNKASKILISIIYFIYAILHLIIFQKLHNESSYGNIINEIQYIVNYSLMIINLYVFSNVIKKENKIKNAVLISLFIYVFSIFISIITKTSSHTYLEGIGFKGYFESGNSLCTVLLLSVCILISNIKKGEYLKTILIIITGIYLIFFSGMRTGIFGFSLVIVIYFFSFVFIPKKSNNTVTKKQILILTIVIVSFIVLFIALVPRLMERRRLLKENELRNIDEETLKQRNVTGDILILYKQIKNNGITEEYMSEAEQKAIIDLCEYAEKTKLSNVNLRKQQFIYNLFLIKEQKNLLFILFGNGYKNQTGELVMEMEIPALICNFGILGLLLYMGPFLLIFIENSYYILKNIKIFNIQKLMYLTGIGLALGLSIFSGYVFFVFSSMAMVIILNILLFRENNIETNLLKIGEKYK